MHREQLAHLLRAASRVTDRRDLLVIGSQSVLGTWEEDELPEAAVLSMEANLAVFDDTLGELADRISGAIGELSSFDQALGYHADGVGVETAVLPAGGGTGSWCSIRPTPNRAAACAWSRTTASISKLVVGRPKDLVFADALEGASLVSPATLLDRIDWLDDRVGTVDRTRLRAWVQTRRAH